MTFHPYLPIHGDVVLLFGITLLLGLMSGELARRSYLFPKISGYIAVGFFLGPSFFNLITPQLIAGSKIFVEISLGLILFDLGRHLDLVWLKHDRGIIRMALAESCLTFVFVLCTLLTFNLSWLHASLAATIAIATSPAVIMMVAENLHAKGPVTRRTFILTSLNNLIALILFTFLLPMTQSVSFFKITFFIVFHLMGSILLGVLIFLITCGMAYLIGKAKENQFILFVGSVMFAIGAASLLNLSSMLVLFTFGVCARNFDFKNLLIEVDFGWLAKLFFILLFVITGIHLQLNGLMLVPLTVFAFLFARIIGKSLGIWLFARSSRLTKQQTWSLCFALTPMAGLAIGMSNIILDVNPSLGSQLMLVSTSVITILNLIGPIATQFAFVKSQETIYNKI